MYTGLTDKQKLRLSDLKEKTTECGEQLKIAIEEFNSEMRELFDRIVLTKEAKLNKSIGKVNDFIAEVVDEATTERDDLDEDTDSDEFERITAFIDTYSSSEMEEISIDSPDDLSEELPDDYVNGIECLNELPETVDDSEQG